MKFMTFNILSHKNILFNKQQCGFRTDYNDDDELRYNDIVDAIDSMKLDIVFIQETTPEFKKIVDKLSDNFTIISKKIKYNDTVNEPLITMIRHGVGNNIFEIDFVNNRVLVINAVIDGLKYTLINCHIKYDILYNDNTISRSFVTFSEQLDKTKFNFDNIIISGDFNCDLSKFMHHDSMNFFVKKNLKLIKLNKPTSFNLGDCVDGNFLEDTISTDTIDYIILNNSFKLSSLKILNCLQKNNMMNYHDFMCFKPPFLVEDTYRTYRDAKKNDVFWFSDHAMVVVDLNKNTKDVKHLLSRQTNTLI